MKIEGILVGTYHVEGSTDLGRFELQVNNEQESYKIEVSVEQRNDIFDVTFINVGGKFGVCRKVSLSAGNICEREKIITDLCSITIYSTNEADIPVTIDFKSKQTGHSEA